MPPPGRYAHDRRRTTAPRRYRVCRIRRRGTSSSLSVSLGRAASKGTGHAHSVAVSMKDDNLQDSFAVKISQWILITARPFHDDGRPLVVRRRDGHDAARLTFCDHQGDQARFSARLKAFAQRPASAKTSARTPSSPWCSEPIALERWREIHGSARPTAPRRGGTRGKYARWTSIWTRAKLAANREILGPWRSRPITKILAGRNGINSRD